jgi:hypothetical protein
MKAATYRYALLFAVALAAAIVTGCADVHQAPTASLVTSDASASQVADVRSPTNVPF